VTLERPKLFARTWCSDLVNLGRRNTANRWPQAVRQARRAGRECARASASQLAAVGKCLATQIGARGRRSASSADYFFESVNVKWEFGSPVDMSPNN